MTDHNPELEPAESDAPPTPSVMPKWVPLLIGAVLVVLAGFAVFTGLRYRDDTITDHVAPRRDRSNAPAPGGEPGAGASLVLPENTPIANAPSAGQSRTIVSGGPTGVAATMRLWARRGMVLNVLPDDAMVHVNDVLIGQVRQFNSVDEVYEFAEPGSYNVKLSAPGHKDRQFMIVVAEDAKQDVARLSVKLESE